MTVDYESWSPDNEVELVIRALQNVQTYQSLERILGQHTAYEIFPKLQGLECLEDLDEWLTPVEVRILFTWAHQKAYKAWCRRIAKMMVRLLRRTTYLPEPVLLRHPVMDISTTDGKRRSVCRENIWRYESDYQHGSLMRHIVQRETDENIPCALPIRNLGMDPGTHDKIDISAQAIADLEAEGFAISSSKLAWNKKSEAWHGYITKMFPNAVYAAAYNRRLNAACVPGGVLFDTDLTVTHIHVLDSERGWIESGKDGSGYIHPDHEIFAQMGIKPCPIQITIINKEDGLFVKGMLFVNSKCFDSNDAPGILVDKSMIKGRMKELTSKLDKDQTAKFTGHMGVLNTNNVAQQVHWGFEQTENILLNSKTKEILAKFMDYNVQELMTKGLDRFLDNLQESSPTASKLIKLLRSFELDPLGVEYLRDRVMEQLNNHHRYMSTGAGIKSPYPRVDIDNRVPEGCIIINDPRFKMLEQDRKGKWKPIKITKEHTRERHDPGSTHWTISPGDQVITFRYPTILSQGLARLTVIPPFREHRKDWQHNKHTIWMNAKTLMILMQGDSDGDQIGVDARLPLVELTRHKIDNNIYHVEFGKTRREIDINTPEGLDHLKKHLRENVGPYTNIRSRLLGVLDIMAAVALSFCVQQEVDAPKNEIVPIDYMLAANLRNYKEVGDHEYKFNEILEEKYLDKEGKTDGFQVYSWMQTRILDRCREQGLRVTPDNLNDWIKASFYWRNHYRSKDLKKLPYVGNTVHWLYNRFVDHYEHNLKRLYGVEGVTYKPEKLLYAMLRSKGHKIKFNVMPWDEYLKGLRSISGIGNYQKKLARAIEQESETPDREERKELKSFAIRRTNLHQKQLIEKIKDLLRSGRLTTQDLVDIWTNECAHPEGKIAAAITATLWQDSPVLKLMDLQENNNCPSTDLDNVHGIISWCLSEEQPFVALTKVLAGITDFDTHTSECDNCTKVLTDALVQQIRIKQMAPEYEELKKIINSLTQRKRIHSPITPTVRHSSQIILAGGISLEEYDAQF